MAETTKAAAPVALNMKRVFAVPRERLFAAFATQEQMDHWMCRDAADHVIKCLKFDFRVGGGIETEIRTPKKDLYRMHMEFREITRPSKISFTWGHEHVAMDGKSLGETLTGTLVTFEFHDRGDSTELELTHQFLPTRHEYDDHKQGWAGCLDELGEFVGKGQRNDLRG